MSQKQRKLTSDAKARLRWEIPDEIAKLKRESLYLQWFIDNSEYIEAARKKNLTQKTLKNLKRGQRKSKEHMLKAVLGGVRAN